MGDKDYTFVLKRFKDALCEDSVGYGWVHSTQGVIEKIDVSFGVYCSCKTDPGFLSP